MEIGSKGIARLGVIPVRSEPSDNSELVTQLLFGDHYTVTGTEKGAKWLRIQLYFDGYEGWIDTKQHHPISREYFEQINNSDYKISTDVVSTILFKKHQTMIVIGSVLPISTNEIFKVEEQLAFNGESKSLSTKRDFEFLKQIARKYINAPYQWGGRSPFGIDCSGFSQIVYKICGYQLPRDASQQVEKGEKVDFSDRAGGDLIFFENGSGKITHVGILLNENEIIHASGKVRIDLLKEDGIYLQESNIKTHHLHSIKRIMR